MPIRRSKIHDRELERRAIGAVEVSPPTAWFMILVFLGLLGAVFLLDQGRGLFPLPSVEGTEPPPALWRLPSDLLEGARRGARNGGGTAVGRLWRGNAEVLRTMDRFETRIEDDSLLALRLIPAVQWVKSRYLRVGNEKVYEGVDRWLFYAPGTDAIVAPGFLRRDVMARRLRSGSERQAPPQPDPVAAILDFRDQLAVRGIELIVLPAPSKATVEPGRLRPRSTGSEPLHNASYDDFLDALRSRGVCVFDPAPLLRAERASRGDSAYLARDSHWNPAAVERVARALAALIRGSVDLPPAPDPGFAVTETVVRGDGDLVAMLRLPAGSNIFPPEEVRVRQVWQGNVAWRASRTADVLLLGDSFSNVFSQNGLGWGESAGLAEQLSLELARPIDRIVRNAGGAHATRGILARELAVGRDRLAGKRVVIWEFAERELVWGDWKRIGMKLGEPPETEFLALEPGETLRLEGVVYEIAPVPRPGSVPYRDHVVGVHLVDLSGDRRATDAYVFFRSMDRNRWTAAARLRVGDRIRFRARPWADVEDEMGSINRGEIDDDELFLVEPLWGELLP